MICRFVSWGSILVSPEELFAEETLTHGDSFVLIFKFELDNELDPLESVDTFPSCLLEFLSERSCTS